MPSRILHVGDSIALGLGTSGEPYPVLIDRALNCETMRVVTCNVSESGASLARHVERLNDYLACEPDVVVIYAGNIDAIPVPRRQGRVDLMRLLPGRYQQPGWLHPRPYLPARWWKRNLYAVPESYLRTRLNRLLMRLQGATNPATVEEVRAALGLLVDAFVSAGASCIVCGLGPVSDELCPGARASFARYREAIRLLAGERGCRYVDVDAVFQLGPIQAKSWLLLDTFHPNAEGHAAIARALLPVVEAALAQRTAESGPRQREPEGC